MNTVYWSLKGSPRAGKLEGGRKWRREGREVTLLKLRHIQPQVEERSFRKKSRESQSIDYRV